MITETVKNISMGVCIIGLVFIFFWFINRAITKKKISSNEIKRDIENESNKLNLEFKKLSKLALTPLRGNDLYYFYNLRKKLREISVRRSELDYAIDNFLKKRQEKYETKTD